MFTYWASELEVQRNHTKVFLKQKIVKNNVFQRILFNLEEVYFDSEEFDLFSKVIS